jgi:flagellar protein FliS
MVAHKPSQYQAYSLATRTVAKTRQVVMLYDGAIRFLRQAEVAIDEKKIEERFKLLQRASEIIVGMQSSIDFDNGGDVAQTLHRFYTGISMRITAVNFEKDAKKACIDVIEELKQMRDIWDSIDLTLNKPEDGSAAPAAEAPATKADSGVSMSA